MSHPVFGFTDALVRLPSDSVTDGLRAIDRGAPDAQRFAAQHERYRAALTRAGVSVHVLPAVEGLPDSVFVEDPALVFPEASVVLRPGAPSRSAEVDALRPALATHFERVIDLPGPGTVEGGDVLVTPRCVYVGLSARTDRRGAEALCAILADLGRTARVVQPPSGVLHLKSACSLLDEHTVLATAPLAASGIIEGMDFVRVAPGEDNAANALRVNDTVFLAASCVDTMGSLRARGYAVEAVAVDEVERLDGGLSCMSLRWQRS